MKIPLKSLRLSKASELLIAMTALCLGMSLIRVLLPQDIHFTFLIFNLFLAWIPYLLSILLFQRFAWDSLMGKFVFIIWLLFFPNAPYIITDLLHLKNYSHSIMWFDATLIFFYGLTGLLLAAHSMNLVHKTLLPRFSSTITRIVLSGIIFLSAFGIYLGRYCRLNSWDLLHRPSWFWGRVLHQFKNPLTYKVTIILGVFFIAAYAIFSRYSAKHDRD